MAVSAHDVAAALRQRQPSLPTKKLHKLLYYCQGHHLAMTGESLFSETISAWDMGPVVGQLWHRERHHLEGRPDPRELDELQQQTVGYVLSRYGSLTGLDLEHLTHQEDPWKLADARRQPGTSARIDIEWIKDYFVAVAHEDETDALALDADEVRRWLAEAAERRERPVSIDSREDILRRLQGHS